MRFSRLGLALKYANRSAEFQRAVLLFFMGTIGFPLFFFALGDLRLSLSGRTATATVNGKQVASGSSRRPPVAAVFALGGRRVPHYYIAYEFTVDGQKFGGSFDVPQDRWAATQVGQSIEVLYLPSDPRVQRASDPIWLTVLVVPLAGGLAAWITGIYLIVAGIRTIRRRVVLIESGTPALGVVEEVGIVESRRGARSMESLRYRFLIETDGRQQMRNEKVKLNLAIKLSEIEVGDLILVVYDPADPARHEIDFFQARQEDRSRLVAETLQGDPRG